MRKPLVITTCLLALATALALTGVLRAQAPGAPPAAPVPPSDPTSFAVAYVDVSPASRAAMLAAFRAYRAASRAHDGFLRLDVLEQIGWAGHFAVVEAWRDRRAFEAHVAAADTVTFRKTMEPLRVTGYDERPYDVLFTAPLRGTPDTGAVWVVAHVDIGGGGLANAPPILGGQAEASRRESGNLRYDVLQHSTRRNHFTVFETWRSRQAHDAHAAAPHTKRYRETVQPLTGSPLDERLYTAVE